MPAHIYYRLGRWKDSIRVNVDAARADEAYLKASGDKGLYRYGYYPHNVHFIVASAQMAGDMPTAIREARKLSTILDPKTSSEIGWIQAVNAAPYFAAAQFASPGQILAMAPPDRRLPYPTAMRHYARAVAYANQRNRAGFDRELGALQAAAKSGDFKTMIDQGVPAPNLLQLAETSARARWAYASGRYADAVKLYQDAAAIESKITYMRHRITSFRCVEAKENVSRTRAQRKTCSDVKFRQSSTTRATSSHDGTTRVGWPETLVPIRPRLNAIASSRPSII